MIFLVSQLGENELVILGSDLIGDAGKDTNAYGGIHGSFGYGVRNLEGERILEMGSALDMILYNTVFKKCDILDS